MIARKFKIPGKVPKLPSQFWQAGHDCHDHKRMAPSEKSAGEKNNPQGISSWMTMNISWTFEPTITCWMEYAVPA